MMDGPHIFGFSPAALSIRLTSTLASARLVGSVRASINAVTLNLVGLVLFSAVLFRLPFRSKANMPVQTLARVTSGPRATRKGFASIAPIKQPIFIDRRGIQRRL